ncbi:MAG: MG2 domain-containing protein [Verrucomicrobia bacterium]|jgi:hypothetical protein|nr:MG2 domain-containing protein [Verrucomicrobiota bacterium]
MSPLTARPADDYAALREQAEALVADGSYAKAHALYRSVQTNHLAPGDQRWVRFRIADTQWRSAAATQRANDTDLESARTTLEQMVRDVERDEDKDRVWVEVQESLGDYGWTRRDSRHWGQAWPCYEQALEWWAGQSELDLARTRYLSIVWRCARPPQAEPYYRYGWHGNYLPLPVLQNAARIAPSDEDRAHAHYLIASTLQQQGGGWDPPSRVAEEYEAALALGRGTDWYDDALFNYAQWMEQRGRLVPLDGGGYRSEPDYVKAVELYRRLLKEFRKGESRYVEQATQQIRGITGEQLAVLAQHIFLPGSEIQFQLDWRNVRRVDFALYPVDLADDVRWGDPEDRKRGDWLHSIDLAGRERVREWSWDTGDKGDHQPGSQPQRLDKPLPPGAYVLTATGGGEQARDLVLVTDAALVLKISGQQVLAYVCDALSGAPLADSTIQVWARWRERDAWRQHSERRTADKDGLVVFDLPGEARAMQLFVGARSGERQAFSTGNSWWNPTGREPWKIYAFTDRPAYRPKETVHWKFTARRHNGSVYSTPAGQVVEFEITDPRGSKVQSDKAALNAFGSAWGSLELTESMPLGEYRIQFWDQGRREHIGSSTLFRLEEYKLPEFKVTVSTPEERDDSGAPPRKKAFRLGDTVEATIQADYYFGGPVANAELEVIVYQNPLWIAWPQPREFPWFYQDMDEGRQPWRRAWGGQGPIIKRETLKTDATGKTIVSFETPANEGQDYEYRIEARVTDASRREIVSSGTVRVTRQSYSVHARAEHNLYRPVDKVPVEFQARDANENPVSVEGTVKVTRQYWWEIWLRPDGTEVKGDELKQLQARHPLWPPPPERPDQKGWKLKFRGYEQDEILTRTVSTDTHGTARFEFEPDRVGYYRVEWSSPDRNSNLKSRISNPVRADTTVWVTDSQTTDIGYRHGGVEIIADRDTFHVGSEAPVMLVANSADRYVLFTVEGENLHSYRLVHLTGPVKLLNLRIEEQHVPNLFLGAVMVSDREIFLDTEAVIVPPTRNFLTVEVTPDREQYQPREEGTLTVTTKDHEGQPVSAEVALSLVDESVFYIQSDYAGDPRPFFFGTKRPHRVQTHSTLNERPYAKLVAREDGKVRDERDQESAGKPPWDRKNESFRGFEGGLLKSSRPLTALSGARLDAGSPPAAMGLPGAAKSAMQESDMAMAVASPAQPAPPAESEPAVVVRSDFRSTLLWQPDVQTGADGRAAVKVAYADSVTAWKATARAATAANQFGIAHATTRTKQPLIVRLQAPRFFVVGDDVVLSAVVNNNTDTDLDVKVGLEVEGGLKGAQASGLPGAGATPVLRLTVPAQGEARADWKATVVQAGEVKLKVTGRSAKHTDAMEKTYVAHEHGIEKFIAKSGKATGEDIRVKLTLPKERQPGSTTFIVQVTPSLAVTMLDALPYLIDYPYGCTEQTMSRFLPAVIVARTLKDLGLKPDDAMSRVFGGIEPQHTAATQPKGKKDLNELEAMTRAGIERLYDFQHGDGGWGWWKEGESDPWMTAYVVWGLTLAQQAGVDVRSHVVRRGAEFLDTRLVEQEEVADLQAWMLHALAVSKPAAGGPSGLSGFQQKAFDNLWKQRDQLNACTRALFALAAHHYGKAGEAQILVDNLENGVIRDDRPDTSVLVHAPRAPQQPGTMGTAHWGEDGLFWRWSDGGVEATAFALRALLAIDPDNKLVEPVTNWLIKNRRGAQWSNTRDTAIVVLALNDYLRASGELQSDLDFELLVNGHSLVKKEISGAEMFNAPSRFAVPADLIRDGENEIRIQRQGEGSVYFAVEAKFFSLEEPIPAAGHEIFVKREYFKLVGRPTLLKGQVYDRVPLRDGDTVQSGERVETILTLEAKNDYEYLVFEDLKPAGFEAVELRSGQTLLARELKRGALTRDSALRAPPSALDFTGRARWVYQELRDRQVALFIDKLPEGVWELRHEMRAEVPGTFHALPVLGHAMYVPEIRCNGDEVRISVTDRR